MKNKIVWISLLLLLTSCVSNKNPEYKVEKWHSDTKEIITTLDSFNNFLDSNSLKSTEFGSSLLENYNNSFFDSNGLVIFSYTLDSIDYNFSLDKYVVKNNTINMYVTTSSEGYVNWWIDYLTVFVNVPLNQLENVDQIEILTSHVN